MSIGKSQGVLVVASLTAAARDEVESAVRVAVGVSLVVLLLASLFIWLAAGRAIAPLQALSRTAKTISETDLSGRIPVRGGDEIADLGRTFNGMLDRLEIAFADQKDFLTDVSHELRTPITVIRGHLETLSDSPREREEAIAVIQDELDRMSRYVDDLLLLAKAPRPDFLRLGPIDLDLFTARPVHQGAQPRRPRLAHRRHRGRDRRGRPQRITQAVMNLADNAVRHTRDGDPIWLGSSMVGDQARLWVRDEGPGSTPPIASGSSAATRGRTAPDRPRARASGSRSSARSPTPTGARGARLTARASARRSRSSSPRPRCREPDPDRRGRGPPGVVPREGPAGERFYDHDRRRRGPSRDAVANDDDFDLLILDLGLPGKDGLDVLRDLRRDGQRLPVIVLTARGDPYDRIAGLETGRRRLPAEAVSFRGAGGTDPGAAARRGDRRTSRPSSGSAA